METDMPRLSIVTPSFNQGHYIRATVESVMAQDYPDVEHIIIDGGSTDQTLAVLADYPHLIVVSEPDDGHADAINKGFRKATGEILGFLNSDDTLVPGALKAIADGMSPANGRHVVLGRCRFIDEDGLPTGIEHPSYFVSHRRMLEIWAGHGIPQPSVFWTREVWDRCGPMDETLNLPWIDYDFFCRVSRHYDFHPVDQLLSCYRLHSSSKTVGSTERDRLEECIAISRRYWGNALSLKHLSLALSLARFRFDRVGKARGLVQSFRRAAGQKHWLRAGLAAGGALLLAPLVCLHYLAFPLINRQALRSVRKLMLWRIHRHQSALVAVYKDHHTPWDDHWVGPHLVVQREVLTPVSALLIAGMADVDCAGEDLTLTVTINDRKQGQFCITRNGPFEITVPLTPPLGIGTAVVEVETKQWFVMDGILHNGDTRPLSWKLEGLDVITEASPSGSESKS
ncbi:MAG: glycosyltransferase [Lentisphaerae bacterium]|nr:glycosyltransferase [Lentisphaerota bacterium]